MVLTRELTKVYEDYQGKVSEIKSQIGEGQLNGRDHSRHLRDNTNFKILKKAESLISRGALLKSRKSDIRTYPLTPGHHMLGSQLTYSSNEPR